MKKCLIVTGGCINIPFAKDFLSERSYDYVIGVDAGLKALEELGLIPDKIVGDLDSADPAIVKKYSDKLHVSMKIYKAEKDETDTELAFMDALFNGCDTADLLGALGGRIDHELSNIQLMYQYYEKGLNIRIYDERNKLYILQQDKTFFREKLFGTYLSFLPITEQVEGLTLKGFKYPLDQKKILLGTSLCISNELTEPTGTAVIEKGTILCVEARD